MRPVPSPPYLSPSFETIEARLWATDTINSVFSKPTSLELPPPIAYQKLEPSSKQTGVDTNNYFLTRSGTLMDMQAVYVNTTLIPYKSNRNSNVYTASLLSSSLSSSSSSSLSSSSDRNQHTPSSNRHSFISSSTGPILQRQQRQRPRSSATLAPTLSTASSNMVSRQSTLTRHLKRHWTVDESTTSGVRRLFTSQQQLKERKAQMMWREKLHGYLIDTAFQIPVPRQGIASPRLAYCIGCEMLATEETYLRHLTVFKQMIIDPFLKAFQYRYMVRDLHTIFSHVSQLITLSTSLVHRWCISIEQNSYNMDDMTMVNGLGTAFCDLEAEFKVYTYYAVHYTKAQKCVARIQQKSVYQQWMHAVLQTKETKRMGLGDYLIAPIQRITRYCLLLKNLLKHTGGKDAGLDRALKYLTALAATMNDCQY